MEIKYKPLDIVYPIYRRVENIICSYCNGKAEIQYKNRKYECPICNGTIIEKEYKEWIVGSKNQIHKIIIYDDKENKYILLFDSYDCNDYDEEIVEQDLFATKEEAQKECDKRNGK